MVFDDGWWWWSSTHIHNAFGEKFSNQKYMRMSFNRRYEIYTLLFNTYHHRVSYTPCKSSWPNFFFEIPPCMIEGCWKKTTTTTTRPTLQSTKKSSWSLGHWTDEYYYWVKYFVCFERFLSSASAVLICMCVKLVLVNWFGLVDRFVWMNITITTTVWIADFFL